MCVRSRNHSCSQSFLLLILVASLFVFTLSIVCHIGVYFMTAPPERSGDMLALSSGNGQESDYETVSINESTSYINSTWVVSTNCSWVQTQVDTGKLFGICEDANGEEKKLECFRNTVLYTGIMSIFPTLLVLLSIVSVCRLLLCPVILLGLAYLLLAIGLLLVCCLYHDAVILNALSVSGTLTDLAIQLLVLIVLYIVLALLHILLFTCVMCERRRAASSKGLKHSTSDDENGLDIDDPRAPLYGYSSRPGTDFDERVKDFKYIDDDMSYILRK